MSFIHAKFSYLFFCRSLAQTQVKALALEAVVAAVDSHYQIDAKKNFGMNPLPSLGIGRSKV
jgi:hypothetical protein